MLESVLVANRGEIAVRLIRAYRELGVRTVAVYSDADAGARHVRLADAARRIGPAGAAESYLDSGAIIAAAQAAGCAAVDPGYGLLSENADFAEQVASAGLVFIGPPARVIAALGNKVTARVLAQRVGVPVVPGSDGVIETVEQGHLAARRLGFPLLAKTVFGGGGRGLRVIENAAQLDTMLAAAAAEAVAGFGRPEVYLERRIAPARHVEVQILADAYGTVLHLGDRDCSAQRRHQKLIEEAPAPFLGDEERERLRAAAVRLAAEAGYVSTGTAEFLYDPAAGEFFFLEMNTRLQVEHGVTELVTGVDLVHQRLAIAAGAPLTLTQDAVRVHGHAIEIRLAAEDTGQRFLPAPGTITQLSVPAGPWLRADFGVEAGDRVPPEYDSMFGKLMAWGPDRESARRRLIAALGELSVTGVPTTAPFLREVLAEPDFIDGTHSITSLEERWLPGLRDRLAQVTPSCVVTPSAPAAGPAGSGGPQPGRVVEVHAAQGTFRVAIYPEAGTRAGAPRAGRAGRAGPGAASTGATTQPTAPMDGIVVKVDAAQGDPVDRHAVLIVIEAMKMQIPVSTAHAGHVRQVLVREGDSVTSGQQLIELTDEPSAGSAAGHQPSAG